MGASYRIVFAIGGGSPMLQRLARACYRRRWRVLGAWIVLLVGLFALNSAVGGQFLDKFNLPGSDSQAAQDIMKAHGFETRTGAAGQVVFQARDVRDPQVRAGMEALFDKVDHAIAPGDVVSPYSPEGARQVNKAGTIAYAQVNMGDRDSTQYVDVGKTVRGVVADTHVPGARIELGGNAFQEQPKFSSEGFGFLAAMVILLIAFGSLLAMGLPLMTALFGIVTGIALVGLTVNFIDMPSFSNEAVAMIGIGVGIDYALFIVTRYREGLQEGLEPEPATLRALDTAGRAVIFAGTTVIIAVMGMFVIGLAMIRGLAVGISIGVLMTMLASITLLPAMFGFVGRNIDRLGLPHRRRPEGQTRQSVWYRWSRVIQRRPWPALVASATVLIVLALPTFAIHLGFGDAGNRPTSDTTRRAYDLISEGFGPGANGPLILAAESPKGNIDTAALGQLSGRLNQTSGVAFASPVIPGRDGRSALIMVQPISSPQAKATE